MMNKQLKRNIKLLDAHIGRITQELEGMKENNRYEVKVRKIEDLTTLRTAIVDKEGGSAVSKDVINEVDRQILELAKELYSIELDETYLSKMRQLNELTTVRTQLVEGIVKAQYSPTIVEGLLKLSAMLVVLKYEEKDVITSKAFDMVKTMFRGK